VTWTRRPRRSGGGLTKALPSCGFAHRFRRARRHFRAPRAAV